jgi:hypothetical protein
MKHGERTPYLTVNLEKMMMPPFVQCISVELGVYDK